MAQHITESHDFQLWLMENNISWQRDCYLDAGTAEKNGEILEDWEMVQIYLSSIGDMTIEGHKARPMYRSK